MLNYSAPPQKKQRGAVFLFYRCIFVQGGKNTLPVRVTNVFCMRKCVMGYIHPRGRKPRTTNTRLLTEPIDVLLVYAFPGCMITTSANKMLFPGFPVFNLKICYCTLSFPSLGLNLCLDLLKNIVPLSTPFRICSCSSGDICTTVWHSSLQVPSYLAAHSSHWMNNR